MRLHLLSAIFLSLILLLGTSVSIADEPIPEGQTQTSPAKPKPWYKRTWAKVGAGCATGTLASMFVPIPILSQVVGCVAGGVAGGTTDYWLDDEEEEQGSAERVAADV